MFRFQQIRHLQSILSQWLDKVFLKIVGGVHTKDICMKYDHMDEGEQKKQMREREEAIAATIPGMTRE